MKRYILILLIAFSCSDEDQDGPCSDSETACKDYLRKMDQATTAKEKEQYYQFYLGEKQMLDACKKSH